ncbi:MAG TPA: hypothetical protein VIJ14_01785 [Rhabdochlamydiaceae bacterium]
MSVSFNTFPDSYVRNIPAEVPLKAAQGFIVTAAISLIAGNAANIALLGGAIAATATLIEAIARPFIQAVFPDSPFIGMAISIFVPNMLALGLAASLAPWIGISYRVTSSFISILAWLALNQQFYQRNVGMVEVL